MAMENALKLRGTVSRDRKKNGGKAGPNGPNGEAGPKGKSKRESGREERKRKKGEKAKKKPKTKKKRGGRNTCPRRRSVSIPTPIAPCRSQLSDY